MTSMQPEAFISRFCWRMAKQGEDNYPPELRAAQCVSGNKKQSHEEHIRRYYMEYGMHLEDFLQARKFFKDMEKWGYNPKQRAEEEHRELQDNADDDIPDLTWEWLENPSSDPAEWPPVNP